VCHGHQSVYCSTGDDADCNLPGGPAWSYRRLLEPLFFEFGVDFWFNGHEHSYERSYPVSVTCLRSACMRWVKPSPIMITRLLRCAMRHLRFIYIEWNRKTPHTEKDGSFSDPRPTTQIEVLDSTLVVRVSDWFFVCATDDREVANARVRGLVHVVRGSAMCLTSRPFGEEGSVCWHRTSFVLDLFSQLLFVTRVPLLALTLRLAHGRPRHTKSGRYKGKSDRSNVDPKATIYVVTGAAGK
jgi:hypothetical protein